MRTFLPGLYQVKECDKRRCTMDGQVREWTRVLAVGTAMLVAMWFMFGGETWGAWVVVGLWFGWFGLRNGWVGMLCEELEDWEITQAFGSLDAPRLARRVEVLWWLVAAVCGVRAAVVKWGSLGAAWEALLRWLE